MRFVVYSTCPPHRHHHQLHCRQIEMLAANPDENRKPSSRRQNNFVHSLYPQFKKVKHFRSYHLSSFYIISFCFVFVFCFIALCIFRSIFSVSHTMCNQISVVQCKVVCLFNEKIDWLQRNHHSLNLRWASIQKDCEDTHIMIIIINTKKKASKKKNEKDKEEEEKNARFTKKSVRLIS